VKKKLEPIFKIIHPYDEVIIKDPLPKTRSNAKTVFFKSKKKKHRHEWVYIYRPFVEWCWCGTAKVAIGFNQDREIHKYYSPKGTK